MIELKEDPLGPLVILWVGGVDDPVPVEGIAQHLELLGEVGDVVVGHLGGMDVVFDGVVLGGQPECVIAHGEQHVIAVHPLLPRYHVHGGVGPGVAHVQALPGGIGKLHQAVKFGLVPTVGRGKGLFFPPLFLPLGLDAGKIVLHRLHFLIVRRPAGPFPPSQHIPCYYTRNGLILQAFHRSKAGQAALFP